MAKWLFLLLTVQWLSLCLHNSTYMLHLSTLTIVLSETWSFTLYICMLVVDWVLASEFHSIELQEVTMIITSLIKLSLFTIPIPQSKSLKLKAPMLSLSSIVLILLNSGATVDL